MGLPSSRRQAMFATLLITAVIVHGSLWPYDFRAQPGPVGPFEALLGTWANPPSGRGDLIANILLYMPFGLLGTLAVGGGIGVRFLLVTTLGAGLSVSMELLQFYDADSVSCMSDFYPNTWGPPWAPALLYCFGWGRIFRCWTA
jgi:hypothetical protein